MANHNELIFEKLEKILVQTTYTNGKVQRLQKDVEKHDNEIKGITKAIYIAMGGFSIISIFGGKILEIIMK